MLSILLAAAALAGGSHSGVRPVWSPDGTRIAFVSATSLQVAQADGSDLRRLASIDDDATASWSPDSRSLTFPRSGRVWTVRSDGTHLRRIAAGDNPAWSPTGRLIAYARGRRIEAVRPDGSRRRVLARLRPSGLMDWSPDATRLTFSTFVRSARSYAVEVVDLGTRKVRRVAYGYSPTWSPGGVVIGFSRGSCAPGFVQADQSSDEPACAAVSLYYGPAAWSPDVLRTSASKPLFRYVFCRKGVSSRSIIAGPPAAARVGPGCDPDWSPDGSRIAFDHYPGSTQIYTMKPDGSDVRPLFSGP